jgi:hypothetical protein
MIDTSKSPLSLRILSILLFIFGLFAFVGSLFIWGEGFLLTFPEGVDYTFPLTDILVNTPASIIAAIGLWTLKPFGYPASQFVAGFYIYASAYIFLEVLQGGPPYPLQIVLPQVLAVIIAMGLIVYGWRYRELFYN